MPTLYTARQGELMKSISICCIIMMCAAALCAEPSWFGSYQGSSDEIIGRGVAKIEKKNEKSAKEQAILDAQYDISRQIFSEVRGFSQTTETEGFEHTQFSLKDIQVESQMSLCNSRIVKSAAEKKLYYVLLSVQRQDVMRHYLSMVEADLSKAISMYSSTEILMEQDPNLALKQLTLLRNILDDLSRSARILNALYAGRIKNILPQISQTPNIHEVDSRISQLSANQVYGSKELAEQLLSELDEQLKQPTDFQLSYIEWLNTGFTSEFSVAFSEYLAMELQRRFAWNRVEAGGSPSVTLSGQLIEEGEALTLFISFRGKVNQTLSAYLSPATINHFGVDKVKPENLENRMKEQEMLVKDSILSNKLQVMVKFMKFGRNPAVLHLNEEANIYIRANKACYVTVINIEANGSQNVLVQNQRNSQDLSNEWIPLGDDFVVVPPTGVEQLFIQADVIPLSELVVTVKEEDGLRKMIASGLKAELTVTRGLAMKTPESQYTEDYLTWTVLE